MPKNTNHRDEWDILVSIKPEFSKMKPFEGKGITARASTAIILAYFGYSFDVLALMQELSHKTRAYIWNAEGLPGFLVKADLLELLKMADTRSDIEKVTKWH